VRLNIVPLRETRRAFARPFLLLASSDEHCRRNKLNVLLFEPDNVKSQVQASELHLLSSAVSVGTAAAAESLRYYMKKGKPSAGGGLMLQFKDGHEELFAAYLDQKYVARFSAGFCTRGCHWFPRLIA